MLRDSYRFKTKASDPYLCLTNPSFSLFLGGVLTQNLEDIETNRLIQASNTIFHRENYFMGSYDPHRNFYRDSKDFPIPPFVKNITNEFFNTHITPQSLSITVPRFLSNLEFRRFLPQDPELLS